MTGPSPSCLFPVAAGRLAVGRGDLCKPDEGQTAVCRAPGAGSASLLLYFVATVWIMASPWTGFSASHLLPAAHKGSQSPDEMEQEALATCSHGCASFCDHLHALVCTRGRIWLCSPYTAPGATFTVSRMQRFPNAGQSHSPPGSKALKSLQSFSGKSCAGNPGIPGHCFTAQNLACLGSGLSALI